MVARIETLKLKNIQGAIDSPPFFMTVHRETTLSSPKIARGDTRESDYSKHYAG
jgi:hypothetical protein